MSQINIFSELVLKRDRFSADLKASEADVKAMVDRLGSSNIRIPVSFVQQGNAANGGNSGGQSQVNDTFRAGSTEFRQSVGDFRGYVDDFGTAVDEFRAAIANIRASAASMGSGQTSPAWLGPDDVVGSSAGLGGGADDSTASSSLMSRRGMMSALIAVHGLEQLGRTIGGDMPDLNSQRDVNDQVSRERQAISEAHGNNLRGFANWVYGKLGLEPTYQDEMMRLDSAQDIDRQTDAKKGRNLQREFLFGRENESGTFQEGLIGKAIYGAAESSQSEQQKKFDDISKTFDMQKAAAQQILDGWSNFGIKTEAEAKDVYNELVNAATTVKTQDMNRLKAAVAAAQMGSRIAIQDSEMRAKSAQLSASGQTTEASYQQSLYDAAKPLVDLDKQIAAAAPNSFELEQLQSRRSSLAKQVEQQQEAIRIQHGRSILSSRQSILEEGRESELRASGQGGLADVIGLQDSTRRALDDSGGDMNIRRAIISRARAQADALRLSLSKSQTFGSVSDYLGALQNGTVAGSGDALNALGGLSQRLGIAGKATSIDDQNKQLGIAGDKLDKAADKLLQAKQLYVVSETN